MVAGRRVLDFGCGFGYHLVVLRELGAAEVWGVDIQDARLSNALDMAGHDPAVHVVNGLVNPDWAQGLEFDTILSVNSMEHIAEPEKWMRRWKEMLAPNGRLLVAFGPTWWSPWGAHVGYITPLPWVHLLFSEKTIMNVRARYRDDGARHWDDVPGGLNRMSCRKFQKLIKMAGFKKVSVRESAVKRLPIINRIPVLRELLTVSIVAILRRPNGG